MSKQQTYLVIGVALVLLYLYSRKSKGKPLLPMASQQRPWPNESLREVQH